MKSVSHLVEAQAPLNWKQLERIGISMMPVDAKGSYDERGNQYSFGNEAAGIMGLRRVDVDPKKSFNYKITDYKKGIRNSRNLFTSATLKGGITTPEEVVDAYINANRALYGINRELYQDMEAAQILGMSSEEIGDRMDGRGENRAFNSLIEGEFRPLKISKDLQEIFAIKAEELNVADPYEAAADVIDSLIDQLENTPLNGDLFPELQNPFRVSLIDGLPDFIANAQLPKFDNTGGFLGQGNINTNQVAGASPLELQLQKGQKVFGSNDKIFS